jgi:cyanophycinase-like exopeptidase
MSVHLIGGGATTAADAPLYAPFVAEAILRASHAGRTRARLAVISLHPEAEEKAAALGELLVEAGTGPALELHLTAGRPGEPIGLDAIAKVDGIAVGGGNVENVRAGLEPVFDELRRLVADGVPYLGVSAGAMIAAEGSLGSGSRIGGVVVSPEDPDEAGDELEIETGIGLVDVAIEVHVAERGMLSRLVAAVESGLVAGGLGIDERTALIVGDDALRVEGKGSVWRVLPIDGGVLVSTIGRESAAKDLADS